MSPLTSRQFALNGFADEVGALLLAPQARVDARKRPFREAGGGLLVIDADSSHGPLCGWRCGNRQRLHFFDITYLDGQFDIT